MTFHDLASLAKPLVTAPLAHAFLDLDADRRWALGFFDRGGPLTVQQLLSHSAGLPPWLPYTGEPLAAQLRRAKLPGNHALLKTAAVGVSAYSDLGYRLVAELLEEETGLPWRVLGAAASGLRPAPWTEPPMQIPPGQDEAAWREAEPDRPFPEPAPSLPHDANAREGMPGHAGFGASAPQLRDCLARWVSAGWPARMAVETARSVDGEAWGLGLQRAGAPYAALLARIPAGTGGVHVVEELSDASPDPWPSPLPAQPPSTFWQHLAYTGPALFVRPEDGFCLALLCHRAGPGGALLGLQELRARRVAALRAFLDKLLG